MHYFNATYFITWNCYILKIVFCFVYSSSFTLMIKNSNYKTLHIKNKCIDFRVSFKVFIACFVEEKKELKTWFYFFFFIFRDWVYNFINTTLGAHIYVYNNRLPPLPLLFVQRIQAWPLEHHVLKICIRLFI